MTPLSFDRSKMIEELRSEDRRDEPFDVLVVGGGITGAGVALDAASRGLRTALVERSDFASGTSSKSSKMIHGGLRYLQNGDIRLVYEALHERRRLMRNAPHLVGVLPFLIPILTRDGVVSRKIARALGSAMWMYDLTGGWRIGRLHRRVSAERAAEYFPTTDPDRLSAGYLYYDAAADDARLTLTIARTAAEHGAVVVNRCAVAGIDHDADGRARSVRLEADGERFDVAARVIVNAAGVWADEIRSLDEVDGHDSSRHDSIRHDSIRPAKGTHIALPWSKIRNPIAVIIPVRRDRRSLSLTPWGPVGDGTFRHTYVGTTDTDYEGPLDEPRCDGDDIDYMLEALNEALVDPIERADITGVWAGLRPLVVASDDTETTRTTGTSADTSTGTSNDKTADLSRRHAVAVADTGVVRVNGGKLTTYRQMAEDTVDLVMRELGRRPSRFTHSTRRLRLLGADHLPKPPSDPVDAHLLGRYGSFAREVKALIALDPDLGATLVPGQPYLRAEAIYSIRHEMATDLDDILLRRTRAHIFDRAASEAAAAHVADLMADELGWTPTERRRQLDHYRTICAHEEAAGEHVTNTAD
jgi:glycerol-3-phosphate dehydrogenase